MLLHVYVTAVTVITTAVTTTFHGPSRQRSTTHPVSVPQPIPSAFHIPSRQRRREWQQTTHLYRDTKQFCINR